MWTAPRETRRAERQSPFLAAVGLAKAAPRARKEQGAAAAKGEGDSPLQARQCRDVCSGQCLIHCQQQGEDEGTVFYLRSWEWCPVRMNNIAITTVSTHRANNMRILLFGCRHVLFARPPCRGCISAVSDGSIVFSPASFFPLLEF